MDTDEVQNLPFGNMKAIANRIVGFHKFSNAVWSLSSESTGTDTRTTPGAPGSLFFSKRYSISYRSSESHSTNASFRSVRQTDIRQLAVYHNTCHPTRHLQFDDISIPNRVAG